MFAKEELNIFNKCSTKAPKYYIQKKNKILEVYFINRKSPLMDIFWHKNLYTFMGHFDALLAARFKDFRNIQASRGPGKSLK